MPGNLRFSAHSLPPHSAATWLPEHIQMTFNRIGFVASRLPYVGAWRLVDRGARLLLVGFLDTIKRTRFTCPCSSNFVSSFEFTCESNGLLGLITFSSNSKSSAELLVPFVGGAGRGPPQRTGTGMHPSHTHLLQRRALRHGIVNLHVPELVARIQTFSEPSLLPASPPAYISLRQCSVRLCRLVSPPLRLRLSCAGSWLYLEVA
jgi:hypothetical protein